MRSLLIVLLSFFSISLKSQSSDTSQTVSLMFIGDIMCHDTQIKSAWDQHNKAYNFDSCFKFIKDVISEPDITIANFETTLGGHPYKGYPAFSSPDELAFAGKNNGIDVFALANNHILDRNLKGVNRTLNLLDSLEVSFTGAFRNKDDKDSLNPLIIKKNNINIALLNYTYWTNVSPVPDPALVNLIDKRYIKKDLEKIHNDSIDFTIVFFHWGKEYDTVPNETQIDLSNFCFENGADIVIGSHPHVIQKTILEHDSITGRDKLVCYSLGNFLSNQYWRKVDGGMILKITLAKKSTNRSIQEAGYYLTWVYRKQTPSKRKYYVLPCSSFENKKESFNVAYQYKKMKLFIDDSRKLHKEQSKGIVEYMARDSLGTF